MARSFGDYGDIAVQVTPTSATTTGSGLGGSTQTLTITYTASDGNAAHIGGGQVFFGPGGPSPNSSQTSMTSGCYIQWFANGAVLVLNGGSWGQGTMGTSGILPSSYCPLQLQGSSFNASTGALTLAVTYPNSADAAGPGGLSVWSYGANSGSNIPNKPPGPQWPTLPWTNLAVNTAPQVMLAALPGGAPAGTQQTFSFAFSDANGAASIQTAEVSLGTTLNGVPACTVTYRPSGFYLSNDSGGTLLGPVASGSGQSISNSSCTIANPSASISGAQVTLTIPITFSQSFTSVPNVYEYVAGSSGMNSGWVYAGQQASLAAASGNCDTLVYGGVNGNPNDQGAYIASRCLYLTREQDHNALGGIVGR